MDNNLRDLLNKNIFHKIKGPGIIIKDDGENITISFPDSSILNYRYPSENFFDDCAFTRINSIKLTGNTTSKKIQKIEEDNELEKFQAFLKKEKIDSEVKEMSIKEDFYNTCIWGFKVKDSDYIPVQDWMDFFIQISIYLFRLDKKIFLNMIKNECPDKNNRTPYYSINEPCFNWYYGTGYRIIKKPPIFIEPHISAREAVGLIRYCQDDYDLDDNDIKIYIGPRFKKRPTD